MTAWQREGGHIRLHRKANLKPSLARSRLEELTFGTFNVRTAAVNGVNGIGHINTLLRTCAAKGCDVIGLQETKRDGTSNISAFGYRVFFSNDCSMVKGRKGQHGVGLAIKEEIVKKASEGGITIECISARLLKVRISNKSNFVILVVAHAPTEEAPEGRKAKYMAALNCIVASVPAREYVRAEEKQTAKCWAHMAKTSSTKTINYCWVSQKTTRSLF